MNTKKILAVSLAATTAFSMFGAAMSVNATANPLTQYSDAYAGTAIMEYPEYAPHAKLTEGTSANAGKFAITAAEAKKLIHFDIDGEVKNQINTPAASGYIYLFDYETVKDVGDSTIAADARKNAKSMIASNLTNPTFWDTSTNVDTLNGYLNAGWKYAATNVGLELVSKPSEFTVSADRLTVFKNFQTVYNDVKDKFSNLASYTLKANTWYNDDDFKGYNVAELFTDIATTYDDVTLNNSRSHLIHTSTMVYLTQEYNRIVKNSLGEYDNSKKEENYATLLENAKNLVEADYAYADWTAIQKKIYDAEYQYGVEKKLDDAISTLTKVFKDHTPKAGNYTELTSVLMTLFNDTKNTSLKASGGVYYNVTTGAMASKAVYDIADYQLYTGVPTVAYRTFAIENTNYIDRLGNVQTAKGAFGVAHAIYTEATTYGVKVAQSRIDAALAMLNEALDSLDANTSAPSWTLLQLESAVEFSGNLVETDFRATSKVYKDFLTAYTKAEAVLAKTRPSAAEIKTATSNLVTALNDLANPSKGGMAAVSYTLTKQLNDKVKEAKRTMETLADQSGAQYLALDKAIKAADTGSYVSKFDTIKFTNGGKGLISDVERAIEDIDAAINYFAQPQGWYKSEDGKSWMYGEDDGYLTSTWLKDGATWYYLNENGLAIQNDWKMIDDTWYYFNSNAGAATGWAKVDGKWYFFDQGCKMKTGWVKSNGSWYYLKPVSGAMVTGWAQIDGKYYFFSKNANALGQMAVNTTIDGYKIDANGVWVK